MHAAKSIVRIQNDSILIAIASSCLDAGRKPTHSCPRSFYTSFAFDSDEEELRQE